MNLESGSISAKSENSITDLGVLFSYLALQISECHLELKSPIVRFYYSTTQCLIRFYKKLLMIKTSL